MSVLAYHGTTRTRAGHIFGNGFLPKPPSRRVWFAESRGYAMSRAKTQARRSGDVPVVLACDLDLEKLRARVGGKGIFHHKGIIAVDGRVPAEVLRSFADLATVPQEVATWVNGLLGLGRRESVGVDHPGLIRLSRWINSHVASEAGAKLLWSQLLERARRWLPEYFVGVDLDPDHLHAHRHVGLVDYEVNSRAFEPDPREREAIDCLDNHCPDERARGLLLLAEIADPDLFDWCAMLLDDESTAVQIMALQTILRCDEGTPEMLKPFVVSEDRRIRGAAISALVKHEQADAPHWIERGLKDPEACVRVSAARFLDRLDTRRDRRILELALHDPNPDVVRRAQKVMLPRRRRKNSTPLVNTK